MRILIGLFLFCFAFASPVLALESASPEATPTSKPSTSLAARSSNKVVITGVLFDGALKGKREPESSIRITNTTGTSTSVGGFVLTDQYTPGKKLKDARRGAKGINQIHRVRIPDGTRLRPHQDLWVAHKAREFKMVFGFAPDFEVEDTDSKVPQLEAERGWLFMAAKHGTVALENSGGDIIDFVAYDRNKKPRYKASELPEQHWKGPPVPLYKSSYYGWTNQILARDRNEKGRVLKDTDSAADWDCGNSDKALGQEPTHRIEIPGQSNFVTQKLRGVKATVLATSAPDNNYKALIDAFNNAKKTIRVSIYQFTNPKVAGALINAKKRGVRVWLWLEGSPVGGIPDKERYVVEKMAKAGIDVKFLVSDTKKKVKARYRFDHSKYVIIDERIAIIGSENYGSTGMPISNTFGNRGWMVHVEHPRFVKQLLAVWNHDRRPGVFRDVVDIHDSPDDPYGFPYREADFSPDFTVRRGFYKHPQKTLKVREKMDLELVLSPDTSLNENSGIIGLIRGAQKVLYVQQNSIRKKWGRKDDKLEDTPDLPLMAIVETARRGVKTRVLLDSTWYNITGDDARDNDDTVAYLNTLAKREGLDLMAKVINLETTHVEKIHTKGVIADDKRVFVGSVNWTENSFKGNREVGVVITNPKIAGYYSKLFTRDWSESRMYQAQAEQGTKVYATPSMKGKVIGRVKKHKALYVVGEHGKAKGAHHLFTEIRMERGKTGYIRSHVVGPPTATPVEAIHFVDRRVTIEGRVVLTKISDKVIQLRFHNEERPPFVAVIFKRSQEKFRANDMDPTTAFQGRIVRVEGMMQSWRMPEIIVSSPDQIEIVR